MIFSEPVVLCGGFCAALLSRQIPSEWSFHAVTGKIRRGYSGKTPVRRDFHLYLPLLQRPRVRRISRIIPPSAVATVLSLLSSNREGFRAIRRLVRFPKRPAHSSFPPFSATAGTPDFPEYSAFRGYSSSFPSLSSDCEKISSCPGARLSAFGGLYGRFRWSYASFVTHLPRGVLDRKPICIRYGS